MCMYLELELELEGNLGLAIPNMPKVVCKKMFHRGYQCIGHRNWL